LYNYTGTSNQDPALNSTYAEQLKQKCPIGDNTTIVEMVHGNLLNFDGSYYGGVLKNQGLFVADAALLDNRWTQTYMKAVYKAKSNKAFFADFGVSMIRMGRIEPLTGTNGTIRAVCGSFIN
jgi:peroxidase